MNKIIVIIYDKCLLEFSQFQLFDTPQKITSLKKKQRIKFYCTE